MRSPVLALGLTFAIAFSGYAFAEPQPLSRAACTAAGMNWDDNGNVCGGGSAGKPAKEEGKKGDHNKGDNNKGDNNKGGKDNKDKKNKGNKKPTKKVVKKVQGNKVTKKVTTSEGTKKSTEKKGASKKEQRKFFKWLKQQDNKKS